MNTNSLPQPTPHLATEILGMWQLQSRLDRDATEQRHIDPILGSNPLGTLSFSSRHFAAQFMKKDRTDQDDSVEPVQGENNSLALNGYDAYFGTYTYDPNTGAITVRLEGSISPSNIGGEFVRDIRVIDNNLIIQLPTTAADGTPITRTLTFSRID